jgi:hypothetical protein
VASDQQDDDVTEKNMFGPDPNWFVSLVMPYLPIIVVLFAARDAWTRRRRQMVLALIERRRKPWIS